jgi:glycosyltransferase involved in cell wall biosynthesis
MFDACLYASMAARLAKIPVVVTTEHGENPWKNALHRWLERHLISPLVDLRFCVSPQILTIRRDIDGVPESKLRLTVNGTVIPPSRPKRVANSVPVIGTLGRFIPAKDYPTLIYAIDKLRRDGYEVNLQLIGDGPEKQNIINAIEECGLENFVQLPGMVSDVDRWLDGFDVYVSSSVSEGQPVAVLEAMAHGLPIVATDVGLSSDTVRDQEGGIIVPPKDPEAIAEAISRLLDDDEMRGRYGKNARARIQSEYSVNSIAESHLAAYRRILAEKHQT